MMDSTRVDSAPLLEFSLSCTGEWRCPQHNVLLEGPEASTVATLRLLAPHLRAPVIWKPRGAPFEPPTSDVGALILEDVDALSWDEQTRLLEWIDVTPRAQVVSTTAHSLFTLVSRGRFDVALYYRLNVVLLDVNRRHDFGFHPVVCVAEEHRRVS